MNHLLLLKSFSRDRNLAWTTDALLLSALILCHPVLWHINRRLAVTFPDSIAYLTLSKEIVHHGSLVLKQWGHVDTGLILPPVYPLFIALTRVFAGEGILAGELASSFCMLLFTIPLYLFVREVSSRTTAMVCTLVFEWNQYSLLYGTAILSEAAFLFLLGWGIYLLPRTDSIADASKTHFFLLGFLCGLVTLTRHIGITLPITAVLFFLITHWRQHATWKSTPTKLSAFFLLGFLPLFGGYNVLLLQQSGHLFPAQQYRMGLYEVFEQSPTSGPAQSANSSYMEQYRNRRALRTLNTAGTEMTGHVLHDEDSPSPLVKLGRRILSDPLSWPKNVYTNLTHLHKYGGRTLVVLFLLSTALLMYLSIKDPARKRAFLILPLYLAVYLVVLSYAGSAVRRYLFIVYPFALAIILIAVHSCAVFLLGKQRNRMIRLSILMAGAVLFALTPNTSIGVKTKPKYRESSENPYQVCRQLITPGEPVFSLHPFDSYSLGGWYRTLPNDSLPRVAAYARKTGVKWMVLDNTGDQRDHELYRNAPWLNNIANLEKLYPGLVRLRCSVYNRFHVYEFHGDEQRTLNTPAPSSPSYLQKRNS
ncbi:MAG: hypothetical protein Kow0089_09670 [Desulfobulbaceae bacterium]